MVAKFIFAGAILLIKVMASADDHGSCTFSNLNDKLFKTHVERLKPLFGKRFTLEDDNKCYQIGVCAKGHTANTDSQNAVMYFTDKCDMANNPITIGRLNEARLFGHGSFLKLEYGNGDAFLDICKNASVTTDILLVCDNKESVVLLSTSNCRYSFIIYHPQVCSAKKLSSGSVLVIVFVVFAATYLIGGILYRRYVNGAYGPNQIPHLPFWKKLGHLAADGCDFCFRCGSLTQPGYTFDTSHDDSVIQP
ncbi:hypothetical protein GJ496_006248 [Pomphorhynchus laevis]|nr:hypothetical protein GJ496_006248 [Pomphorhynchus laevis]